MLVQRGGGEYHSHLLVSVSHHVTISLCEMFKTFCTAIFRLVSNLLLSFRNPTTKYIESVCKKRRQGNCFICKNYNAKHPPISWQLGEIYNSPKWSKILLSTIYIYIYMCVCVSVYIYIYIHLCIYTCVHLCGYIYMYDRPIYVWPGRVFTNGLGNRGSISGQIIPKIQKMVLDAILLNAQHYKVRIEGKGEQSRERSSALLYTSVL